MKPKFKKKIYFLGFLIALLFSVNSHCFYHQFSQEPFINFMPAQTFGKRKIRFNLQHHYDTSKIASANIRLGYGIYHNVDINLATLSHSIEITSKGQTAKNSINEFEIETLVFLSSEDMKKNEMDLSLFFSISRFNSKFAYGSSISDNQKNYYAGYLVLSKRFDKIVQINISPTLVHDSEANKNVLGVVPCIKLIYKEKYALIAEYPFLINNPFGWQQPWSAGIQIKHGPHQFTIFGTNTYGFTISNILNGNDRNYFGFRISI